MAETEPHAGEHMAAEIAEQPRVLADLIDRQPAVVQVAKTVNQKQPRFVLLAARGSSDHAALYAKYLLEVLVGLPAGLVSPSTVTLYGASTNWRDVLLISVSQSGSSPDLIEVTETARKQGALTVSVTNNLLSPLNEAAELTIDIGAGTERAVAATKTYSATLLSLYLLVDAIRGGNGEHAQKIGNLAQQTLNEINDPLEKATNRYRFANQIVATGRGYSYATALEAALKLAETSYLPTRAYSGADLLHGPIAALDRETAVLAVMSKGNAGEAMTGPLSAIANEGADIVTVGSVDKPTSASLHIPIPATVEELSPVLEALPVQSLALRLALDRGIDPDHPQGLTKVTKTR